MSNLITVSGVKGYIDENGIAWLNLENIARGLGFTEVKNQVEYVRYRTVHAHLESLGYSQDVAKEGFVTENIFYLLAMKASNQTAVAFQMKVANEILPSIRKTGSYSAQSLSPQLQLLISMELKQNEMQKAISDTREAQFQNQAVLTSHEFALSTMDQRITNEITLTSHEQSKIQGAVSSRVNKFASRPYQALYSALKRHFGVPSYKDIRKSDLTKAFEFIRCWSPRVQ